MREFVTPFMGVWIEIYIQKFNVQKEICHSLHGSAD